jgi:hypothetical protein
MNKDQQIEEMARAIEQARIKATDTTNSMNYGFGGWYANELYNADYRKSTDVAREIFEEIDRMIYKVLNDRHYIMGDMCYEVAELKKKYTEEKKDV